MRNTFLRETMKKSIQQGIPKYMDDPDFGNWVGEPSLGEPDKGGVAAPIPNSSSLGSDF